MSGKSTHILYIAEFSTGGSIESLLTLIGGLDKQIFRATILFDTMPEPSVCERINAAGGAVLSIHAYAPDTGAREQLSKYNLQAKVRRVFGRRIERLYESLKYILYFFRFRYSNYRALCRQIREIDPDLVHLNTGVATDTPGQLAARRCRVPAVCHVRDFDNVTSLSYVASRSVRAFICISSAVSEHLIGFNIEPERCIVVPNAVDLQRFNEVTTPTGHIREEYGWDATDKVIALVGRVVSWKGQDYFIRAIAEARASDASIRGLIVGSGESSPESNAYVARLISLISELGLDESVSLTGYRSDIPSIMKDADIVICASSSPEPFGRVIIESMALGTPVIATNAGGATDIISDGETGLLVAIKDSGAMAQAISRLGNDFDLRERLRTAALRAVSDRYTSQKHAERISDIYCSVLGLAQPN
jgi:glycosyltransferase involved in cell wall biosynthesis